MGRMLNPMHAENKAMNQQPTSPALHAETCCASLGDNSACRANSAENATQDGDPCPHCGSLKDPWFSRVLPMSYHCQDCGKDVDEIPDNSLHNS